ncbi:sugar phosphate nucleotidyltransferase [Luxibacter massiliensis]|uniref:sugar phosphate nucleotidyltransferase n=1 Tax=Luxibacter massiliensis TaxID=2219695 RepID=UPI000F062025|nr:sugar phosphate nucleotidyltransferase [Luxibacter massiliensis]
MGINDFTIPPNTTVRRAIEKIDKLSHKAVFITDTKNKLLGLFTEGDMRKFILADGNLSAPITEAMNTNPVVFDSVTSARIAQKEKRMVVYPVVSSQGELMDVIFNHGKSEKQKNRSGLQDIPLVIMAGGKGTRLYPYTKVLPKALIPIGDITITERIINQFHSYGCRDVHFILNHKANMIKSYYDDLSKDYVVHYYTESTFLGTGGGLGLLKGQIHNTFFLSNCDIIINDDLDCAVKTHKKQRNVITFLCAVKNLVVPYGVVNTDAAGQITQMVEKPEYSFLTNTGVYIIEPEVIEELPENKFIHFPEIAKRYMDQGQNVGVFPISESSWMDMGEFTEMNKMMKVFEGNKDEIC